MSSDRFHCTHTSHAFATATETVLRRTGFLLPRCSPSESHR